MLAAAAAKGGDGARASLVNNIRRNTERLQSQVQQLLELARLHRGAVALFRETWDLRAIVEESALAVRPLTEEKGQTLAVACPSAPCPVEADRERIEQVIINLLSNASKFTPRQGSIELDLREEDGEFVVSVKDTGPGIPFGEQERVFDRFYSRSRGPGGKGGTGLGLAIAKALVELHGGRIWVSSQRGRGSTFSFTLPKGDGHEGAHR
jgi:two-component system phosphate regulon sensor histidine kinase PhoR